MERRHTHTHTHYYKHSRHALNMGSLHLEGKYIKNDFGSIWFFFIVTSQLYSCCVISHAREMKSSACLNTCFYHSWTAVIMKGLASSTTLTASNLFYWVNFDLIARWHLCSTDPLQSTCRRLTHSQIKYPLQSVSPVLKTAKLNCKEVMAWFESAEHLQCTLTLNHRWKLPYVACPILTKEKVRTRIRKNEEFLALSCAQISPTWCPQTIHPLLGGLHRFHLISLPGQSAREWYISKHGNASHTERS